MSTTVVNVRHEPYDKYIGRGTRWGNPYVIGPDGNRETVIRKFRERVMNMPELVALAKKELTGKRLGCHCAPAPCHGDVWVEICDAPHRVSRNREGSD